MTSVPTGASGRDQVSTKETVMSKYCGFHCSVLITCILLFSSHVVHAEILIIGSDSPGYRSGQLLPDNPTLDIDRCTALVLWKNNEFLTLAGPYKGTLSAYKDPKMACFTIGERESAYDQYFKAVCEKQKNCDAVCKAVFQKVIHKADFKLQCP
jgi:hypothetical protein